MRRDYDITIPDMLFPSDNELEIPTLDINMQAECCQIPFLCFGEQKRTYNMNGAGTLHFYTAQSIASLQYTNIPKKYTNNIIQQTS